MVTGAVASHHARVAPWTAMPAWYGDRLDPGRAVEATRGTWDGRARRAASDAQATASRDGFT